MSGASAMQHSAASKGQLMKAFFFFLSFPFSVSYCPYCFACVCVCPFRALKAGMQRPLLVCPPHKDYKNSTMAAALGALQALYMVRKRTNSFSSRDNKGSVHTQCLMCLWSAVLKWIALKGNLIMWSTSLQIHCKNSYIMWSEILMCLWKSWSTGVDILWCTNTKTH